VSCAPVNNNSNINNRNIINDQQSENSIKTIENIETINSNEKSSINKKIKPNFNSEIQNNITIILSKEDDPKVVRQFINIFELSVYQKKLQNISFKVKIYKNSDELIKIVKNEDLPGKIFIGPLSSSDTALLEGFCNNGAIFFSFSSNKNLANNCIYLVNFFLENELRILFNYFPNNSKIALLYPENIYGFTINKIIDKIANQSNSIIVNRASYNEDLINAPEAIKELGKYDLRKYELNRQKKILSSNNDDDSKKRLIKLERFQTTKDLNFTHVIIADYGLRLLQVAPLLPYYDIDPNLIKFVGTGAWDDEIFYDEPSLAGSIYPGIEFKKRKQLFEDYFDLYDEKPLRISTLPFDLVGLLSFVINNKYTLSTFYQLLDESNTKFSGVDGSFYFLNNAIERDLSILEINKGVAITVSK
jgi:hypothetical protein